MVENKQPRIKILVACHKADPNIRQDDIYMPIQVGKALHPELDLGFQCDNTGDNISEKNGSYCELTALYWAWKNLKDVDYIGLCHYRRYFKYDFNNLVKDLHNYDVIALKRKVECVSASSNLIKLLCQEDFIIALDTLLFEHPEMEVCARDYLYKNNKVSQANMFIMRWDLFDKYCQFLFSYLANLEVRMKEHAYTRLRRNIGYIAENFQGLYFMYNHFKIKYVPKEEVDIVEELTGLKSIIRKLRDNIVFNLYNHNNNQIYQSVVVGLNNDGINLKSRLNKL